MNTIPSKFKCAGFEINVEFVDKIDKGTFGCFDDATNVITIARNVLTDNGLIELSERQIMNTFLHELCHVFQWYSGKDFDETVANIFANFILEYTETKTI